ncbi:GNAT family N-acetyltransferase [bacterium]|nr:GNAT family N-acetyltransferase [bacterium]RQV95975.1 MAG: N-acetyltransferase [bacterium]
MDKDRAVIHDLFWEYLKWANSRLNDEYDIQFDIKSIVEQDMRKLDIFFPPTGRLLLANTENGTVGVACMRKIQRDIGEIKRMYVRSRFRGKGIGRALLEKLISEARMIGYPRIRLDSSRFMKSAHSLYRSAGFCEIEPYPESEIPPEFQHNWIFMEKQL